jgi:hypothetical protein
MGGGFLWGLHWGVSAGFFFAHDTKERKKSNRPSGCPPHTQSFLAFSLVFFFFLLADTYFSDDSASSGFFFFFFFFSWVVGEGWENGREGGLLLMNETNGYIDAFGTVIFIFCFFFFFLSVSF